MAHPVHAPAILAAAAHGEHGGLALESRAHLRLQIPAFDEVSTQPVGVILEIPHRPPVTWARAHLPRATPAPTGGLPPAGPP